jgi:hypothetical protein
MTDNIPVAFLDASFEPYDLTASGILYLCAALSDGGLSAGGADSIRRHMEMAASISTFDRKFIGSPMHTLSYFDFLEVINLHRHEGMAISHAMALISYKTTESLMATVVGLAEEEVDDAEA